MPQKWFVVGHGPSSTEQSKVQKPIDFIAP